MEKKSLPLLEDVGEDSIFEVSEKDCFDAIIVGAGVSGSFIADELTRAGKTVLLLEAGKHFKPHEYPRTEIDANSQLYWSGGVELNTTADIGLLRPKAVGGGSIVNQALVDRFDEVAFSDWRDTSGIDWFNQDALDQSYRAVEAKLIIQTIDPAFKNGNAKVFEEGFAQNGFQCAPLRRAQRDCKYGEGNDCIECLAGCRIQSKQSTPWTTLARARETGRLKLLAQFEVNEVSESTDEVHVSGISSGGLARKWRAKKLVLASGAIGNTKLLMQSGFDATRPALGKRFFTHPQFMHIATYERELHAEKGPLQSFKSADPNFRKAGFKLENVFAPPVSLSMLLPGVGASFVAQMRNLTRMASIEVAVRDTEPGVISLSKKRVLSIKKTLNVEDQKRKAAGFAAVDAIFKSTGAKSVVQGNFGIGLHLMGGCGMGTNKATSVVGPDFRVHGCKRTFAADSSVFPSAPGINPSLTIMALSVRAAEEIAV